MKHASAWYTDQLQSSIKDASKKSRKLRRKKKKRKPRPEDAAAGGDGQEKHVQEVSPDGKKRRRKRKRKKKRKAPKDQSRPERPPWNCDTKREVNIPKLPEEPSLIFSEGSKSTAASTDPWIRKKLKNPYLEGDEEYERLLRAPPPPEVGAITNFPSLLHPPNTDTLGPAPMSLSHSQADVRQGNAAEDLRPGQLTKSMPFLPKIENAPRKKRVRKVDDKRGVVEEKSVNSLYASDYGPYSTSIAHKKWRVQAMPHEGRKRSGKPKSIFLEKIKPSAAEVERRKRIKAYCETITVRNKTMLEAKEAKRKEARMKTIIHENRAQKLESISQGLDKLDTFYQRRMAIMWFKTTRIFVRIQHARRRKQAIETLFRFKKEVVQRYAFDAWAALAKQLRQRDAEIAQMEKRREQFHIWERARASSSIVRARKRDALIALFSVSTSHMCRCADCARARKRRERLHQ